MPPAQRKIKNHSKVDFKINFIDKFKVTNASVHDLQV